ncbi:uncharacterized protein EV154DRAFT_487544 [Mucor mucedo]|uniref:uncharacterized protein n=1 Tax=Mucor mucedo TaxID=29922 RepID=UPI002220DC2C|nr:uncharacterized protein EV154DRAFT_487544 [Mucor mucedo]KAI7872254.1 hypothetical protein EV154DRAFT_487544 [Mucor mucedo]
MYSRLLLNLTALLAVCCQITQAFCVYNKLEGDRVRLSVIGSFTVAPPDRIFHKEIDQGGNECCPYTNADCVTGGQRDSLVKFHFKFAFDLLQMWEVNRRYTVYCEGGAGLVITGSNFNNLESTCFKANGEVTRTKLETWTPVLESRRVRLSVSNPYSGVHLEHLFSKEVSQGGKECCPYTDEDCIAGIRRNTPVTLHFKFAIDKLARWEMTRRYTGHCEGGAGIVITGSRFEDIVCTCYKINGESIRENLVDWTPT